MATVFKRQQSPNFYIEFTDVDGKRVLKSTGTRIKREADEFAANIERQVRRERKGRKERQTNPELLEIIVRAAQLANEGNLSEIQARKLVGEIYRIASGKELRSFTIAGWFTHWLESKRPSVKESTMSRYENSVRSILSFLGKHAERDLSQFTTEHVEGYKAFLAKEGGKASTKNLKILDLRRIIKAAHDERLLEDRPGQRVELFPETDSAIRAPFTEEEIRQLLYHANDDWKGIITIGFHTGLRINDITRMKWNSVKFEENRIVITPQKQAVGKGRKGRKKVRIPMTASVRRVLQTRERKGEFVFPSLATKAKSVPSYYFERLRKKAGVPKEIEFQDELCERSFHSLRHSFVSFLANAEIPAELRQELAAHASKDVHQIYVHRDEAQIEAAMTAFNDITAA